MPFGIARALVIAVVAGLLLAGSIQPALAADGTVTGTLRDDDTGWVAAGVVVHACGAPGCMGNAVSGPDGQYSLELPAAGGWNVFTEGGCAPGDYARGHQYSVNVIAGATAVVNIHLTKKKGGIVGHVLDSTGAPVANVGMVMDNAETGGSGLGGATSGADGGFSVDCLAAAGVAGTGTYYITSFPPAGNLHGQQQESGIRVLPDQETVHNVVLVDGVGSFSGRVTCAKGACGASISVLVYCEGCPSAATVQTDIAGQYSTGPLAAGRRYDVHAVGPPGWDNEIYYGIPVAGSGTSRVDVVLTAVGPASSGSLGGHILDGDDPLPNCLINAFGGQPGTPGGGWVDGDLRTAEDGSFDSDYRLVPGDYLVFVVCPGRPQVRANLGRPVRVSAGLRADVTYVFPEPPRPPEPRHWLLHVPSKELPLE